MKQRVTHRIRTGWGMSTWRPSMGTRWCWSHCHPWRSNIYPLMQGAAEITSIRADQCQKWEIHRSRISWSKAARPSTGTHWCQPYCRPWCNNSSIYPLTLGAVVSTSTRADQCRQWEIHRKRTSWSKIAWPSTRSRWCQFRCNNSNIYPFTQCAAVSTYRSLMSIPSQ